MFIRTFRARVHEGKHVEFKSKLVGFVPPHRPQGLIAYYVCEPVDNDSDEFAVVTVWKSMSDMIAHVGSNWSSVVLPDGELPELREAWVHHYEVCKYQHTEAKAW